MNNVMQRSRQAEATAAERAFRPARPSGKKDWPALPRMLARRGINYRD